jgi:hypothetical protein
VAAVEAAVRAGPEAGVGWTRGPRGWVARTRAKPLWLSAETPIRIQKESLNHREQREGSASARVQ